MASQTNVRKAEQGEGRFHVNSGWREEMAARSGRVS